MTQVVPPFEVIGILFYFGRVRGQDSPHPSGGSHISSVVPPIPPWTLSLPVVDLGLHLLDKGPGHLS